MEQPVRTENATGSESFGVEKNMLSLLGIDSRFLGYPADSLVIIPTALYLLSPAVNITREAMCLVTLSRARVTTAAVEKQYYVC